MFGNHCHWMRRSWFTRTGVHPLHVTTALLGGVALGYAVAVLLGQ
jgi:hypothetical protein